MRTIFLTAVFITLAGSALAASYQVIPKAEQKLTPQQGGLYQTSMLAQHNNAIALITLRDKSGEAEGHADWEDYIFIQEGQAQLTLGGSIENPRTVSKGETRGSAISGGKTFTVHPGDYIYVPVNVPHRMMVAPGTSIRYAVVKAHP